MEERAQHASEEEWVEQALAGPQEAFGALVQRYERPVFSLILRMIRDRALAEDLTQDTFVKAYRKLSTYDRSRKLSSWLFKIAHNTTIDHLRRQKADLTPLESESPDRVSLADVLEDDSTRSPEDLATSGALGQALERSVGELREEYREVVLLRFSEGLAYQEIADVTGLALGTVKTHLHRARKQLMESLARQGFSPNPQDESSEATEG